MNTRIKLIIVGIVFISIGVDIWTNEGGIIYRQPIPQISGIILILFGLFMLVFCIVKSKSLTSKEYICQNCQNTIKCTGEKEIYCPKCDKKMEFLKGFYDRHPELKDKPEK